MKRKTTVHLSYCLLVGAGLALAFATRTGNSGDGASASATPPVVRSAPPAADHRPPAGAVALPDIAPAGEKISPACRNTLDAVAASEPGRLPGLEPGAGSMGDLVVTLIPREEYLARIEKTAGEPCPDLSSGHPLAVLRESLGAACSLAREKLKTKRREDGAWAEAAMGCYRAVLAYRFAAVDRAIGNTPLSEIRDPSVLMNKVIAGFALRERPDAKSVALAAERILELEPGNRQAAAYALKARYLAFRDAPEDAASDRKVDLLRTVEAFERIAPQDELLEEIRFGLEAAHREPGRMRKLALEAREKEPRSRNAAYYLAWASFLEGRSVKAKSLIREQVAADPGDVRAHFTLTMLERAPSRKEDAPSPFVELAAHLGALAFQHE